MEVLVGGRRIPYLLKGSQPDTIVFLPSLGTTAAMWDPQISAFSSRYTVIAPELGGHDNGTSQESLDAFANDLEAVLNAVGSTQAHVVGISLGGMIAQRFALGFPDRLRSLVLINTTCSWDDAGRRRMQERADQVRRDGMTSVVDGILARWFTGGAWETSEEHRQAIRAMLFSADPDAYAAAARAISTVDTCRELDSVRVPTLVVRADEDRSMPENATSVLLTRIPRATEAVMTGVAHLCTVQAPVTFNTLLAEHLRRFAHESSDDFEQIAPAHPW